MKTYLSNNVIVRAALISAMLAGVSACGGGSSSSSGERTQLTLNEETQFMVIGRTTSILEDSHVENALRLSIMLILGDGLAAACDEGTYSVTGTSTDGSISFHRCDPESQGQNGDRTWFNSARLRGQVSVKTQDDGMAFTLNRLRINDHFHEEKWDSASDEKTSPTETYTMSFAFDYNGQFLFGEHFATFKEFTADLYALHTSSAWPDYEEKMRYTLHHLVFPFTEGTASITLHEAEGDLPFTLQRTLPTYDGSSSCPIAGGADWTDKQGNTLNLTYQPEETVVITLNGVATEYNCSDLRSNIEPFRGSFTD